MEAAERRDVFAQHGFTVRFDWGPTGALRLATEVDVLVIVDVLSFTTAVEVAVARGARVYPFRFRDDSAASFARSVGAVLAVGRQQVTAESPYSLSPASLVAIPPGTRLVLPSPNGATVSVLAADHGCIALAGCLRNATATAALARDLGEVIGIVAAGERWGDGSLRPAYEDCVGAGAIADALKLDSLSPEAHAAVSAFRAARDNLPRHVMECVSGRELIALGYARDVEMASELDVSCTVPKYDVDAFTATDVALK